MRIRGSALALACVQMGIDNPVHLLFIAVVALVVLGPRRLPEVTRALGHGIREFREAISSEARPGAVEPTTAPVQQVADPVDPAQAVRSDGAPDSRPL
jgi:sec-independent protein translocase protein TatA